MSEHNAHNKSYLAQMAATLPAFGAKTVLGDLPVRGVEQTIKARGWAAQDGVPKPAVSDAFKKAIRNNWKGTAMAGALGAVTAPRFVKGIQLAGSDDKKEKAEGLGLIGGSAAIYQGAKGYAEGHGEAIAKGLTGAERAGYSTLGSLYRAGTKTPIALAMGMGIVAGRKDSGKKDSTPGMKYIKPALLDAGLGAATGAFTTYSREMKGLSGVEARSAALARAGVSGKAGAAAGLVGGALSALVVDKALAAMKEKKAWFAPKEKPYDDKTPPTMETPPTIKQGITPYPHQLRAVEKLVRNRGNLIMAHAVGTGKTSTSIIGVEELRHLGHATNTLVVVPAGLRENFAKDGLTKFLEKPDYQIVAASGENRPNYVRPDKLSGDKQYSIVSYQMFARDPVGLMKRTGADTIIMDEFHKSRNEASGIFQAAGEARALAKNFIGLTGSLINNDPAEVASLMTISKGQRIISPTQYKQVFTKVVGSEKGLNGGTKVIRGVRNHGALIKMVDPNVDVVTTESLPNIDIPKKKTEFVQVPMSDEQYKLYQMAMKKLGPVADYVARRDPKVIVKDLDPKMLFALTSHARQISNSVGMGETMSLEQAADQTPKVKKLLDDVELHIKNTPDAQVVIYSNLIRGGVDVLNAGLKQRGIDPAMFIGKDTEIGDGKVTSESRDHAVEDFKAGKKKVILLSGAGAEGLSLNDSTAFFELDGHFNPERIMQAEARAVRLGGQQHRAPDKRQVEVKRYVNVVPKANTPGFFGKAIGRSAPLTTDQWMYDTAGRKFKQNKDFFDTMSHQDKYIRKYMGPNGQMRYEYPRKPPSSGVFGNLFGS